MANQNTSSVLQCLQWDVAHTPRSRTPYNSKINSSIIITQPNAKPETPFGRSAKISNPSIGNRTISVAECMQWYTTPKNT